MRRAAVALLAAAALALCGACRARLAAPEGSLEQGAAPTAEPRAAWARVLAAVVGPDGALDPAALGEAAADLERYAAWLATTSPDTAPGAFEDDAARLAYWLNAYVALGLRAVVAGGVDPADGQRLRAGVEQAVGGRWTTLDALARERARPLGDERVWLALADPGPGAPDPPPRPFDAAGLEAQLDERARAFFDAPRHCLLRADVGTLELSRVVERHLADFLAAEPRLADYVNRHRTRKVPRDAFVRFQSPAPAEAPTPPPAPID